MAGSRRRCLAALIAALLLVACQQEEQLPAPQAEAGVLHLWREGRDEPIVVTAATVHQEDSAMQRLRLQELRLLVPLSDGRCRLSAPRGRYRVQQEAIVDLQPPVHLEGVAAGSPFTGRARRASIVGRERRLVFEDLILVQDGQRLEAERAVLPESWGERELHGANISSAPASALWTAGLGALPRGEALDPEVAE